MNTIAILLIAVGLPVVCGTMIIITFMVLSSRKMRKEKNMSADETRILQEMHQSLLRMEQRIDALETIYFDTEKKNKGGFHESNI